ncbi:MAG: crossover junction endodeoxyribonuclease RuvC [Gammaproteobacteria bacterium]|jgi:crossover junction endodeoxyribonuclease RuvC|nr:crossover junction endodeoxyribonuclease RuvC [Gammaproteobacteria bacterium]MDP6616487.1 crossover junction endodeoxyribonuclease RuvC [Gammaproteobacteria bacterium]MDP6694264.1 crossover junction endodeoxyribonuclease RuvC [Gammaproteobacteria bacterium]
MRPWTRVLGIDPGSRVTGYGILDTDGQQSKYIASGVIKTLHADKGAARLEVIFAETNDLIENYQPAELAIERVFVSRNADSALKLGQARAAAICATFGTSMPVYEYAAREVKQAVVGKGNAEKEQVQHMVRVLLSLTEDLSMDASDALGVALCHAHTRTTGLRLAEAMS